VTKWEIRPPLHQKPLNRSSPISVWVISTSGAPTLTPNFITIRLYTLSLPLNMRKCASSDRASFLALLSAKTPAPIFMINTSNDVISRRGVPFGGRENKISHFDPNFSQNENFWPIFDGTGFSRQKASTVGMLRLSVNSTQQTSTSTSTSTSGPSTSTSTSTYL